MPDPRIQIGFKLNILPGDRGGRILIPGCEPTSVLSSTTIHKNIRDVCNGAFVYANDAVAAIPGSRIEFVLNMERAGGSRVFVLPPFDLNCPCCDTNDWYEVLRSLAETPDEDCTPAPDPLGFGCRPNTERDQWRAGATDVCPDPEGPTHLNQGPILGNPCVDGEQA